MTDLAEFLLARIAEDEAAAKRACGQYRSRRWHVDKLEETVLWYPPEPDAAEAERRHGLTVTADQWRGQTIESAGDQIAPHIARHDPARVLADCAAKRRIIERTGALAAHLNETGQTMPDRHSAELVDGILADLVLPYADHPDYREEWRP